MSVYEKRYNVHSNMVSNYTDDPRKALALLDRDPKHGWCAEGYADAEDIGPGHPRYGGIEGTEYIRRSTGAVSRQTLVARIAALEFREQREKVQQMIKALRAS